MLLVVVGGQGVGGRRKAMVWRKRERNADRGRQTPTERETHTERNAHRRDRQTEKLRKT